MDPESYSIVYRQRSAELQAIARESAFARALRRAGAPARSPSRVQRLWATVSSQFPRRSRTRPRVTSTD